VLYVSRVFQWARRLARMLEMQKCIKSYVQLKRLRQLHRRVCRWQYKGSTKYIWKEWVTILRTAIKWLRLGFKDGLYLNIIMNLRVQWDQSRKIIHYHFLKRRSTSLS